MRVLKALAALLSYPRRELQEVLDDIRVLIDAERKLRSSHRAALDALVRELQQSDLIDVQERYVALFDRGRATSLNLYEHVHGDSRDRGQAMVDLVSIYRSGGLELATSELPDHLPVLLEYLATRPDGEAREMLKDCAHLLRAIGDALVQQRSRYAAVLSALLALAGERGLAASVKPADPEDTTLDDEWVEQPVLFGLGCGDARRSPTVQPVRFVRKSA
jgi:nitrate reductase delta subunit